MRLRQLAAGHAMGDYLKFIAEIAKAQGEVLGRMPAMALPTIEQIESALNAGVPLLLATEWKRDPAWTGVLRDVLGRIETLADAGPARDAVHALSLRDDAYLDAQADRLLAGVMLGLDLGTAPLIAAGLQVYFTHLVAAAVDVSKTQRLAPFGRIDDQTLCPCCGSKPTASITRIGAQEAGYRYLACSLCSAQWHMVRIKCSNCLSTKGIAYQSLRALGSEDTSERGDAVEGATARARAVEVESCAECRHYLKIVHMERDPEVEPIADDLASITLDLLASDAGETRHGVNLMLVFGDPEPEAAEMANRPDGGGG